MEWVIGFICSAVVAGLAYWKKSLSASGFAAAVVVGTVLYALGNAGWYGTLLVFFITSTLWSRWNKKKKHAAEAGYAKGGRRDAGQVLANGALGVLFCAANAVWPHPLWWAAFVGVMAAVTADTWATEIGGISRSQPRSIVSGRRIPAGTSGGVTPLGLAATLGGGLLIGFAAWALLRLGGSAPTPPAAVSAAALTQLGPLLLLGAAGGVIGSLADSLLGATVQVMYRCPACGKQIEKPAHCGAEAVRIRGWSWMTNDTVNVLGSLAGTAAAVLAASVWAS